MKGMEVNILVGVTGSVAAIKLKQLVERLKYLCSDTSLDFKTNIKVVVTEHSLHFFDVNEINEMATVLRDVDEWKSWKKMSDPVLHIELRRWADLMVIAPLDANTLAKLANGICDNLLTCVVRAWDCKKPFLFCPAMNTYMWNHPITGEQIEKLKSFNYIEIPCIEKELACGDIGLGAMAEVPVIVKKIASYVEHIGKSTTQGASLVKS